MGRSYSVILSSMLTCLFLTVCLDSAATISSQAVLLFVLLVISNDHFEIASNLFGSHLGVSVSHLMHHTRLCSHLRIGYLSPVPPSILLPIALSSGTILSACMNGMLFCAPVRVPCLSAVMISSKIPCLFLLVCCLAFARFRPEHFISGFIVCHLLILSCLALS